MTLIKVVALGAGLTIASAAGAQSLRVNDVSFINAARCQGLYNSPELGPIRHSGMNRFVGLESAGRQPGILDRAITARDTARREAATADPAQRAQLNAERMGPCRQWAEMGAHATHGQLTGD
jgi:hypothetical protein